MGRRLSLIRREPGVHSAPQDFLDASNRGITVGGSVVSAHCSSSPLLMIPQATPALTASGLCQCNTGHWLHNWAPRSDSCICAFCLLRSTQEPMSDELQEQWAVKHEFLPLQVSTRVHRQVLPR